jgi:hypothetical protein
MLAINYGKQIFHTGTNFGTKEVSLSKGIQILSSENRLVGGFFFERREGDLKDKIRKILKRKQKV